MQACCAWKHGGTTRHGGAWAQRRRTRREGSCERGCVGHLLPTGRRLPLRLRNRRRLRSSASADRQAPSHSHTHTARSEEKTLSDSSQQPQPSPRALPFRPSARTPKLDRML